MKTVRGVITAVIVVGLAFAAGTFSGKLHSQQDPLAAPPNPTPLYVATFIDLMPPGAVAGTAAIKQYVVDTRKEPGLVRCEAIAQMAGRANHLVVIEVWKDQSAFAKHETTAHTRDYRAKMLPLIGAPFDEREHFVVQ